MRGERVNAAVWAARDASSPRPDPLRALERLSKARRVADDAVASSITQVNEAVHTCGLDLPASQVARSLTEGRRRASRGPVRRLKRDGPRSTDRTPFQVFGGIASLQPSGADSFATLPTLALSPVSPTTHGSGFVYRWRFRFGATNDAFGGDPFYEECLEQAEQSYRPAYVQLLPPAPDETYGRFAALFVQDDDSAYQFTGTILRKQSDAWNLDVSDLSWFAGELQSALDPGGGASQGWRPISIAAVRYHQPLGLFGPIVEKTDYAVAWLRDGVDPADHRVLFATLNEFEEKAEEQRTAGFRTFSGVRTHEGIVTLWIRDEVGGSVVRPSLAAFQDDMAAGYRPIHISDGLVIGVRQTDNSYWNVSEAQNSDISAFMSDVNELDLQAPCFTRGEGGIWSVGVYGPRRGIGGMPVVAGTPLDEFVAAGDVELDRWLREDIMATKDISAAVLAVARDGEIVVSRGYTFGTQAQPLTQPETPFRMASVAKPLTAVAVMRLIQEHQNEFNINTPVFEIPGMPQPVGYPDAVFEIRIKDLLQHRCGWGRNATPDPDDAEDGGGAQTGKDGPLSRTLGGLEADLGVPVQYFTRSQLVAYGLNVGEIHGEPADEFGFIGADVGSTFRYSNFGYMLLAQLIEVVSNYSYVNFVQTRILDELGMTATRPAVSSRFHVPRTEPNYDGDRRYMGDNVPDYSGAFDQSYFGLWSGDSSAYHLPNAYGGTTLLETVDAAGGWVSSAPDMIRFLRSFDGYEAGEGMRRPGGPEILSAFSLSNMWGSPIAHTGSGSYLLGWYSSKLVPSGGVTPPDPNAIYQYSHGGNSAGVFALALHRGNGNAFMAFNRNRLRYYMPTAKMKDALADDSPP